VISKKRNKLTGKVVCLSIILAPCIACSQVPNLTPSDAKSAACAPLYLDPLAPTEKRVDDLIGRMTLEEKTAQLLSIAPAISRLKVPAYNYWSEALHGVGNDGAATVFPQAIGFAATWNPMLVHEMADAISTEARARHHEALRHDMHVQSEGLTFWSPNINIFRDPRWGRGQETYGEDPFLTSRIGVAFVTGLQGDDPKYLKVLATPKHFAAHSGPEPARHAIDVQLSRHDIEDTYLPAFRAAVVEGNAGSVMCAYNSLNGEPSCANSFLLDETLRRNWQFKGFVVSDCAAITDIYSGHKYVKNIELAAAISMKRGTDLDCDFSQTESAGYLEAAKKGDLNESEIDRSLRRLFTARFRLGMFDPPSMVKYAAIPFTENDSEAHRGLALEVARQSMVLLKNDGILPLKKQIRRIAVIGPLGDSGNALLGNYNGMPSRQTTVIDGIREQFKNANVSYVAGTNFLHNFFPVPRSAFATESGKTGLTAEYFTTRDLSGPPASARIDPQISFGFGVDRLPQWAELNGYTARWSGKLSAPESGTYSLQLTGGGGVRIWIDNILLVDDWNESDSPSQAKRTFPLHLIKGEEHPIKLEYLRFGQVKDLEFPRRATAGLRLLWKREGGESIAEALSSVRDADVVIAAVGITAELESEEYCHPDLPEGFKCGDRTSLDLPKPEQELIEVVKATGKPLVLVLMSGSALSINWAEKNANAILQAWYPGEEGGTAVAQTLAGVNNPAGRLPVTFYRSAEDLPAFDDYRMSARTYRYFKGPVLYPFGYGLSYSRFEYSSLKLSAETLDAGSPLSIDVDVENTSNIGGDEVAELYESFPGVQGAPIRALRGFQRVRLAPREKRTIHFSLSARDMSWVNQDGSRVVSAGRVDFFAGGAQPGNHVPGVEGSVLIRGERVLPD
jgi:beta-glucosidase